MRRFALVCCLAAACSSGGSPATDVPPTERPIRYQASSTAYAFVGHRQVEQEFQGQVNRQQLTLRLWLQAEIAAATADAMTLGFALDSVAETGGGSTAGDLAAVRGATWTAQLLPTGEVRDLTGPSDAGLANQLFNMAQTFYPRLPAAGVSAGDAWVDTVTSTIDVGGVELTVRSVSQHEAIGPRPWLTGEAFLVRVATDYTLQGEGNQSGQPLTLEGEGRRHVDEYLSASGRYLGSVTSDTSSYEVILTALGMSIPGRQWRTDTLRATQ